MRYLHRTNASRHLGNVERPKGGKGIDELVRKYFVHESLGLVSKTKEQIDELLESGVIEWSDHSVFNDYTIHYYRPRA